MNDNVREAVINCTVVSLLLSFKLPSCQMTFKCSDNCGTKLSNSNTRHQSAINFLEGWQCQGQPCWTLSPPLFWQLQCISLVINLFKHFKNFKMHFPPQDVFYTYLWNICQTNIKLDYYCFIYLLPVIIWTVVWYVLQSFWYRRLACATRGDGRKWSWPLFSPIFSLFSFFYVFF